MTASLLLELGTEELPPTALTTLGEAFQTAIQQGLLQAGFAVSNARYFASPRHLGVLCEGVPALSASQQKMRKGPLVSQALIEGKPSPALLGFAKSCNVLVDQLIKLPTDKGEAFGFMENVAGISLTECLQTLLPQALQTLPVPKRMRWGSHAVEFVRPVHTVMALYGTELLALSALTIPASNSTVGHRVHHPSLVVIPEARRYEETMREAHVLVNFDTRKATIAQQISDIAQTHNATPVLPEALLLELAGLAEWPEALTVEFDPKFLALPKAVLITVMQKHQRYVALEKADGTLLPLCVVIVNQHFADPKPVQKGHARVLRARFEDAKFFYTQDCASTLESKRDKLQTLTFQEKLGSLADKEIRIAGLAKTLGKILGADEKQLARAARLAKADLVTMMVSEFGELQGEMGAVYAQHDGEDAGVALALQEQYLPKSAKDALPTTALGLALALSDRIDSLVALFGIGFIPTGTKDPYALRRAALAVLRILIEKNISLNVAQLIAEHAKAFSGQTLALAKVSEVMPFIRERLYGLFNEQGIAKNIVDAALSSQKDDPYDIALRIKALASFLNDPAAKSLSETNKRLQNILQKNAVEAGEVEVALFHDPAEKSLYSVYSELRQQAESFYAKKEYTAVLKVTATLSQPLAAFFESVMVMADDLTVRNNRLRLLAQLRSVCSLVGDLSCL